MRFLHSIRRPMTIGLLLGLLVLGVCLSGCANNAPAGGQEQSSQPPVSSSSHVGGADESSKNSYATQSREDSVTSVGASQPQNAAQSGNTSQGSNSAPVSSNSVLSGPTGVEIELPDVYFD